jgi:hypothetical protein
MSLPAQPHSEPVECHLTWPRPREETVVSEGTEVVMFTAYCCTSREQVGSAGAYQRNGTLLDITGTVSRPTERRSSRAPAAASSG